jgi:cysteine-rich repeat protein
MWDVRAVVLMGVLALSGCPSTDAASCGDGFTCPTNLVCAPSGNRCARPADIRTCADLDEGAICGAIGGTGVCADGACVADECGDGVLGFVEVCDDYNTVDGDGCSADCQSTEGCGNGIIELEEQCDCGPLDDPAGGCLMGNSVAPEAECNVDCLLICGDGFINEVEQCDVDPPTYSCVDEGYDFGVLACLDGCALDVSACQFMGWDGLSVPTADLKDVAFVDGMEFSAYSSSFLGVTTSTLSRRTGGDMDVLWFGEGGLDHLSAPAADDVWAVGLEEVVHFDGVNAEEVPLSEGSARDVWADALGNVLVVGRDTDQARAWWRGGDTWVPADLGGSRYFQTAVAVAGESVDRLVVAARRLDGVGLLYELTDGTYVATTPTVSPRAVDCGAGLCIAVGDNGLILASTTIGDWAPMSSPTTEPLTGVVIRSVNEAYAVGAAGTVLHYNGRQWQQLESPTVDALNFATQVGDTIATGSGFRSFHLRSAARVTALPLVNVWEIAYSSEGIGYAYNGNGVAHRFDGAFATELFQGGSGFSQVAVRPNGVAVFAAGSNSVTEYEPPGTVLDISVPAQISPPTQHFLELQVTDAVTLIGGLDGFVALRDAAGWRDESLGESCAIFGMHLVDESDFYVSCSTPGEMAGGIWRYQSGSWTLLADYQGRYPRSLWGDTEGLVVAFSDGSLAFGAGTGLSDPVPTFPDEIFSLTGTRNDLFAAHGSQLSRYDGSRWSLVRTEGWRSISVAVHPQRIAGYREGVGIEVIERFKPW